MIPASVRPYRVVRAATDTIVQRLDEAIHDRSDVILVVSGDTPPDHVLTELAVVGTLANRIGAVVPRVQGDGPDGLPSQHVARRLPRIDFIPLAAPSAVWLAHEVLADYRDSFAASSLADGLFAFLVRINRSGYRLAVANHAMVDAEPSPHVDELATRHAAEFPEATALLSRDAGSAEHRSLRLLSELPAPGGPLRVLFDLDHLAAHYNGTFEVARALVTSSAAHWPDSVTLLASAHESAWRFHGLDKLSRVQRIDPSDRTPVAAVIRVGQPYVYGDLWRTYSRSPVVVALLLDAISYDCGYLSLAFDPEIWRFATQASDAVVANSVYTLACITERFPTGDGVTARVIRHSLDAAEYGADVAPAPGEGILVVGNGYAHKFVDETTRALAAGHLGRPLMSLGWSAQTAAPPGVSAYPSGALDPATLEQLYASASCVVFPSHYEGFGLPILNALARHRPVYVRDLPLFRELAEGIPQRANIHFYRDTAQLVEALQQPATWVPGPLAAAPHNWAAAAMELLHSVRDACEQSNAMFIRRRLERLDASRLSLGELLPWLSQEQRIALKLAPWTGRLLRWTRADRWLAWRRDTRRTPPS